MAPLERLAAYIAGLHPMWRETPWEQMDEGTRALFLEDARGALRVIREPTETMIRAGHAATERQFDLTVAYTGIWQAMLDATE